ncbi:PDZ domain-containing protein [Wenzhouxiangella sp. XN24]|uniref:PDZ domain-containing protein n=1 Tax=Wenzhouxiangella sp. XN24 TaxID=2713569 RepID=UPI0013EDAA68|nr:PDZ domain-containing protein [Wenzhouxiangella sp. XN24]NGX14823.1 PDZ domain-containing protein [Wenzhouxiangella sp. XN24]
MRNLFHGSALVMLMIFALGGPYAIAEPEDRAPAPEVDVEVEVVVPPDAEADARFREARARLEAAAREIAELTAQAVGESSVEIRELLRAPRRMMLGVSIGPTETVGEGEPGEARAAGVQVLGVTPGGPAEEAGIRSGDVLLAIGDTELDWTADTSPTDKLLAALDRSEAGDELELRYRRADEVATAAVEIRPWTARLFGWSSDGFGFPTPPDAPRPPAFMHRFITAGWGDMELVELTPTLGEYFSASEGVLVVRAPSDPVLGLQDGDVIVDIAGRKPADPGHVVRILRSYAPGERLVMTVIRKGKSEQLEADIPG